MLCCSGDRRILPAPSTDLWDTFDTEWDPPVKLLDRFLFMPVMVCPNVKSHLKSSQNFVKSISEDGKPKKIDAHAFLSNVQLSPGNFYLPFEVTHFNTKDGLRLHGVLVTQPKHHDKIPTIIFLHGNSGNIGDNLPWACTLYDEINCNIFMFDYRGYGFSAGEASERGVYWDAQAAYDYIDERPDINSRMIVIHGQSIGGAVAIDLAVRQKYKNRIAGLIIENTFSSLAQLLQEYTRVWYFRPLRLLFGCLRVSSKLRSIEKMELIKSPTLFICSLKDKIIPPDHSRKLYTACNAPKRIYIAENGEHLTAYLKEDYVCEIKKFLRQFVIHKGSCNICGCGHGCCCNQRVGTLATREAAFDLCKRRC